MDNLMSCFLDALKNSVRNGSITVDELPAELKSEVQMEVEVENVTKGE